jgi:hypothetical protein
MIKRPPNPPDAAPIISTSNTAPPATHVLNFGLNPTVDLGSSGFVTILLWCLLVSHYAWSVITLGARFLPAKSLQQAPADQTHPPAANENRTVARPSALHLSPNEWSVSATVRVSGLPACDIRSIGRAVPLLSPRYAHDGWKDRHQEDERCHAEREGKHAGNGRYRRSEVGGCTLIGQTETL